MAAAIAEHKRKGVRNLMFILMAVFIAPFDLPMMMIWELTPLIIKHQGRLHIMANEGDSSRAAALSRPAT
jgi:hypothetical protein